MVLLKFRVQNINELFQHLNCMQSMKIMLFSLNEMDTFPRIKAR